MPSPDDTTPLTRAPVSASQRAYWEARLTERYTLGGVGWVGLGERYNRWLYRVRRDVFTRVAAPLLRPGARVLNVGSGTGFYVDLWRRLLDDERYRRALAELSSVLRPGGHLVLTENFSAGDGQRAQRQVLRTGAEIRAAVRDAGLTRVTSRPMLVLLNTPVGDRSALADGWWRLVESAVPRGERVGAVLGALVYPVERVATRVRRSGPSTRIVVCRKTDRTTGDDAGMSANPRFEQPQLWGHLADDPNIQHRAAMLEEMIPEDVTSILDVGCGDGGITNRLARRWDVTGVDQSAAALEHLETAAVRASALDLPFPDGSFDLVLSSEMLEHLPPEEYRQATRELRRVARRYVLVSVPYREDLRFRTIRCPRCGWRGHVWGHRQVFTVESLIADLDGFEANQVRVFGARQDPVWPCWLLWATHNVLRQFYWAPGQSPMCARCGNTEFAATRAIHPLVRRLNARMPGRTRVRLPFCLAVLTERAAS